MYSKIEVTKFEGLNSTIAPELISDGQARDIMNLRMEKIGKLVSRNGIIFGLFTDPHTTYAGKQQAAWPTSTPYHPDDYYQNNKGLIGLGEMILEERWDAIDTDRLMVYVIRSVVNDEYELETSEGLAHTQKFKEAYLFSPMDGAYKNILLTDYNPSVVVANHAASVRVVERSDNFAQDSNNDKTTSQYDQSPEQWNSNTHQLYAPNRWIPCIDGLPFQRPGDHWIDQYVDINQYRHRLVISDRINGDMILEDFFSRRAKDIGACGTGEHGFHLRPNCLDPFDIDIVELDPRFRAKGIDGANDHEENSYEQGVKHGMALYKYVLPELTIRPSDLTDNMRRLSDSSWMPKQPYAQLEAILRWLDNEFFPLPLAMFNYRKLYPVGGMPLFDNSYGSTSGFNPAIQHMIDAPFWGVASANTRQYFLSNKSKAEVVDNIFGELKLGKDEYYDSSQSGIEEKKRDDGIKKIEYSSDVFIWDDFSIQYYPSSGDSLANRYEWYLRDLDKFFNKLTPGIPRITKLRIKDGYEREVALGVWKYRFVWDYGNGVYSAPSATLLCPDIIWSAINDSWIYSQINSQDKYIIEDNSYRRPRQLKNDINGYPEHKGYLSEQYHSVIKDGIKINGQDIYSNQRLTNPEFVVDDGINPIVLTTPGDLILQIKNKLFIPSYKFGSYRYDSGSLSTNSKDEISNMFVSFLLKTSDIENISGPFWEGALIADGAYAEWQDWGASERNADNAVASLSTRLNHTELMAVLKGKQLITHSGELSIPMFSTNDRITYNSIFDNQGRLRLVFTGKQMSNTDISTGSPYLFRHQLVLPECNSGFGVNHRKRYVSGSPINISHPWYNLVATAITNYQFQTIYYNCVCTDYDENNALFNFPYANDRTHTLSRGIKEELDKFESNINSDILPDIQDRLILKGYAYLPIINQGDRYWYESEIQCTTAGNYTQFMDYNDKLHPSTIGQASAFRSNHENEVVDGRNNRYLQGGFSITNAEFYDPGTGAFDEPRYEVEMLPWAWDQSNYPTGSLTEYNSQTMLFAVENMNNLEMGVYLPAERFIGLEQLSSYFPSSLLFTAPRMGIKIPYDKVPANAKKLLIFRTKCSHANDWQPNEYGLIDTIDIRRVSQDEYNDVDKRYFENGVAIPVQDTVTEMINGSIRHKSEDKDFYHGIYYFDKIRDENIDWTRKPSEYEGMRRPLASAFNIALNESMYYLNFKETYQPIAPRKNEYSEPDEINLWTDRYPLHSAHLKVFQLTSAMAADGKTGLQRNGKYSYRYVYEDEAYILSSYKQVDVTIPDYTGVVVFYLMPHSFDNYIKCVKIFRSFNSGDYYYIGKTDEGDEGIFIDDGLPDGALMPCTEPDIENYESGLRWSEPFRPDWIKMESFAEYRSGDGKQATGIETLYGNLVIFKETSMHRVAVQAVNPPISRTDEISAEIGCIAPNTLININNVLYFLSWKGLMSYDNNTLKKIDGMFDEELQYLLTNNDPGLIRDCSCGYNPAYNELYLNIPMLPTLYHYPDNTDNPPVQRDYGQGYMYEEDSKITSTIPGLEGSHTQFMRMLLGHIYVVNLDKGYATKFSYTASIDESYQIAPSETIQNWLKKTLHPLQLIHKYYTNSYGELRSGDILPNYYGSPDGYVMTVNTEVSDFTVGYGECGWTPDVEITRNGSHLRVDYIDDYLPATSVTINGVPVSYTEEQPDVVWSDITSQIGNYGVARFFTSTDGMIMYARLENGDSLPNQQWKKSVDGGQTWSLYDRVGELCASRDCNIMYNLAWDGNTKIFQYSIDAGVTWQNLDIPTYYLPGENFSNFRCSPLGDMLIVSGKWWNGQMLFAYTQDMYSMDYGVTWNEWGVMKSTSHIGLSADLTTRVLTYIPSGPDKRGKLSVDSGATWNDFNLLGSSSSFEPNYCEHFALSDDGYVIITGYNPTDHQANDNWGTFISKDRGTSWSRIRLRDREYYKTFKLQCDSTATNIAIYTQYRVDISTNGGNTWIDYPMYPYQGSSTDIDAANHLMHVFVSYDLSIMLTMLMVFKVKEAYVGNIGDIVKLLFDIPLVDTNTGDIEGTDYHIQICSGSIILENLCCYDIYYDVTTTTSYEPTENAGACWAGIYIETPYILTYEGKQVSLWDTDDLLDSRMQVRGQVQLQYGFPQILKMPVHSVFRSKFFTGDDETLIKRVRKVALNLFSKGSTKATGTAISGEGLFASSQFSATNTYGDDRISNKQFTEVQDRNSFIFNPTIEFVNHFKTNPATSGREEDIIIPWQNDTRLFPITRANLRGTQSNLISFIPTSQDNTDFDNRDGQNYIQATDDFIGKPIRFSVELDCWFRTQLNELSIHWRPIHSYLA